MPLLKKTSLKTNFKTQTSFISPLIPSNNIKSQLQNDYKPSSQYSKSPTPKNQIEVITRTHSFSNFSFPETPNPKIVNSPVLFDESYVRSERSTSTQVKISVNCPEEDFKDIDNLPSSQLSDLLDDCVKANVRLSQQSLSSQNSNTIKRSEFPRTMEYKTEDYVVFDKDQNDINTKYNNKPHFDNDSEGISKSFSLADTLSEMVELNRILSQANEENMKMFSSSLAAENAKKMSKKRKTTSDDKMRKKKIKRTSKEVTGSTNKKISQKYFNKIMNSEEDPDREFGGEPLKTEKNKVKKKRVKKDKLNVSETHQNESKTKNKDKKSNKKTLNKKSKSDDNNANADHELLTELINNILDDPENMEVNLDEIESIGKTNKGKLEKKYSNKILSNGIDNNVDKNSKKKFTPKNTIFITEGTKETEVDLDFLLELQKKRDVGLYVYCDKCDKVRYLPDCKNPLDLPDKWYCNMNPDPNYSTCDDPDYYIDPETEDLIIHNKYNAGSLVWAKMDGYPWWPAMVDDDPDIKDYFWLDDEDSKIPSWYHVTFFDCSSVTRAWLRTSNLEPFLVNANNKLFKPKKSDIYKYRLDYAMQDARQASKLTILNRLRRFGFVQRYFKKHLGTDNTEQTKRKGDKKKLKGNAKKICNKNTEEPTKVPSDIDNTVMRELQI